MCFISFVEEYWPGQKPGTTIGRIEVHTRDSDYADEEIGWATARVDRFNKFRARWDFRDITAYHLEWLREYVKREFCGRVENREVGI